MEVLHVIVFCVLTEDGVPHPEIKRVQGWWAFGPGSEVAGIVTSHMYNYKDQH
jgi:hypothetical protein